jgi:RNA polymerase sigma-70 factor (ECF subfamily)
LNSACSNLPPCHPAREQILDHLEVVIVKNAVQNRQSEELLIARARGGSSEAFTDLVFLHSPQTYRVSLTILRNHADAEDNVQDVFYKAYKNIHRFEGRSRFSSWLVRITVNEALMKIRSRQSERLVFRIDIPRPEREHSAVLEIEDDRPDPERQFITSELAARAFHGLHPLLRHMFTLHAAGGWTHRELAGAIGITVSTAKSRIFRARAQMQQRLHAHC